ncbi:MAG TPA: VCBS repeat-containing protein, partial [Chryseosolibacter sp.]|nr:VCBS repeat-containing protein [Chryseosolibacter sp.]
YRNQRVESGVTTFTEVSAAAGIHGGGINFGLGVSVSDVNNDGWPDLFVTNDYEEQDFLYINNGDGTFRETASRAFGHISRNGMGTDIADFNNDGRTDVVEADMWPEDNYRQKLLKGPDDFNRYMLMVDSGFHHQQMRNTLQVNGGCQNGNDPVFCEIGQLAGVAATDWSWAPLFADLDNDGLKDLFMTNGYLRDFTSLDFLKYTVEEERRKAAEKGKELPVYELVAKMSSTKTADYVFHNNGDLTFSNFTKEWGLASPNLSFGAAYADLDNDGDLELITNNTNERATVWLNHTDRNAERSYLRIRLKGPAHNPFGIGARVTIQTRDTIQTCEQFPTRGFQSAVEPVIHFGTGSAKRILIARVTWPDGRTTTARNISTSQVLEMSYASAMEENAVNGMRVDTLFRDVSRGAGITFKHRENAYTDFDHEPLIPFQLSRLGPALAHADVNSDGGDDFYVGGAFGQAGALYLSHGKGQFMMAPAQPWAANVSREDVGAAFFDAEGDGDVDLFVVAGGNEVPSGNAMLDDQLYLNNGHGMFTPAPKGSTVADHASGSCVTAADYDKDGDMDLYVGGRVSPGNYPVPNPGAILKNESTPDQPKFVVATKEVNPDLREPGMVTDAIWTDFNGDTWPDLVIVGEWMPVRLFENRNGRLVENKEAIPPGTSGFWHRIAPFDMDADGDIDYVLGNAGANLPWRVSDKEPLTLYYGDFNADSRIDPIMCFTRGNKEFPVASRDEMFAQMNTLRKKFTTYSAYARATIGDVLEERTLQQASKLVIDNTRSSVLENLGNGRFRIGPLPVMAQFSAVTGVIAEDFNHDGHADLLLAGNFFPWRTQFGPSDASIGLLLSGDGKGNWRCLQAGESGFFADGDVRRMARLRGKGGGKLVLVARNNDKMSLFDFD